MKKRIHNLLLFILIFISILSTIILNPLNDLDEIWNYNFARNIANGLVPYKDFNIVVTPLLSIICGIILKITFQHVEKYPFSIKGKNSKVYILCNVTLT